MGSHSQGSFALVTNLGIRDVRLESQAQYPERGCCNPKSRVLKHSYVNITRLSSTRHPVLLSAKPTLFFFHHWHSSCYYWLEREGITLSVSYLCL